MMELSKLSYSVGNKAPSMLIPFRDASGEVCAEDFIVITP
ncbi:hypothetical protein NOC27_2951 [Nitrosococcus oceani AFC27]|nr:hypothetical protein NOC27_2951 [Nitrosococcus oceani AFC27]